VTLSQRPEAARHRLEADRLKTTRVGRRTSPAAAAAPQMHTQGESCRDPLLPAITVPSPLYATHAKKKRWQTSQSGALVVECRHQTRRIAAELFGASGHDPRPPCGTAQSLPWPRDRCGPEPRGSVRCGLHRHLHWLADVDIPRGNRREIALPERWKSTNSIGIDPSRSNSDLNSDPGSGHASCFPSTT
jgi:hypothetical protein